MNSIAFIDSEIDPNKHKILDIGAIKDNGNIFHNASTAEFTQFIIGSNFICGHNILQHDLKYLWKPINDAGISVKNVIDTLHLSPLLFPTKPYHALLKDDKLQTDQLNNPLNDSIKARDLFYDEINAFQQLEAPLKSIFYHLLHDKKEFAAFFRYIGFTTEVKDTKSLILNLFKNEICENSNLSTIIPNHPIELAYALALIHSFIHHQKIHSITPPWVLRNYPEVERIMLLLRNKPCVPGCAYCHQSLDIYKGLKYFFGFDSYRNYGGEPLQAKAVKAAVENKSLLAVFPTGGGKSITFQVPALMSGVNTKGLTVIISPLQSLMKDQVDNLEKIGITDAVTINGLLDPIERAKSFERIEDGSATLLYISPESLRSKTIERLILGRKIIRFVIDEAHCFSSWGQDFRVDYLYIGDFIQQIQKKKMLEEQIPVSCFTATAKQKVIEDIRNYFKEKLNLDLELFTSKASRANLQYKVFEKGDEEDKYQTARDLITIKNCPTIIYVSRTRKAYVLAERLSKDGINARPYHGKMNKQEKSENQDAFINGDVQVMVATSAFGMGVDKKDVGMVIHFEISDSLENYIQEAGRAGRDESMTADCYVLFNEEDLSKHFILLNETKLSIKEIQQIWKAIKEITRFRSSVSNSALEIARKAGWDDTVAEIETRVTTAIAALEDAGYLKRGQNMPKVFANSILSKNAQEAIDKIMASNRFEEKQKEKAVRIIKKLFSSKSKKQANDESGESRIDYISDHLGIVKEEVINIIHLLREEKILADTKDLTAFIKKGENKNRSIQLVETYKKIENLLLPLIEEQEKEFHIKELNEAAEKSGFADVNTFKINTIINFWSVKNWIKRQNSSFSKQHFAMICLQPKEKLSEKLEKRHELARFIIEMLYQKSLQNMNDENAQKDEILVEFSVHELKQAYENKPALFKLKIDIDDIEDTLFYLSKIEAIKIEGGFMVVYNRLTIERTEQNNKKQYTKDDYQKLFQFYENKIQQIHIVGEYAKKMIEDYKNALQFVEDYFQLNYSVFLNKYFKGGRQNEIKRNLTPAKFQQLFGELSPTQLKIIKDNESKNIVVAAGPGSGKTKVLVHKLASLLLMEDVKHEQLLMLTFSRAAATEFRKRLISLIGNAASFIEIKTFHSYCFDLLGKIGNLENADSVIQNAVEKIKNREVEINQITKTVLVIDEAQDMNKHEFGLVETLMEVNEEMRVIAVGDDDQNIFEFRGADNQYLEAFIRTNNAVQYELIENYRSKNNIVELANQIAGTIQKRLKNMPIIAIQKDNGNIQITEYSSNNLTVPLVNDIMNADISGTTCVLTKTNDDALEIAGLFLKYGIDAKLIQTNLKFKLYNILEIRFFYVQLQISDTTFIISEENWESAKRKLFQTYRKSSQIEVCMNFIKTFELAYPKKKYTSDFQTFLYESKLEDFYNTNGETIFISTIHKAKGKEFDNIFLMLQNFIAETDEEKRLLYVALTRAKRNLNIHCNSKLLSNISAENTTLYFDNILYNKPIQIAMHLTFADVWLGYFRNTQYQVSALNCGDELQYNGNECLDASGKTVIKFSKKFSGKIASLEQHGYVLKTVKVNFILYWKDDGDEHEIKIILPELIFERQH